MPRPSPDDENFVQNIHSPSRFFPPRVFRLATTDKNLIPTEPMYPIFDLAVGGPNNSPNATTPFPAVMNVDYIRIWQQR